MFHLSRYKLLRSTTRISFVRFLYTIGVAAIETIWAIYLYSFGLSPAKVGFFIAILNIVTIGSSFIITPILHKFHKNTLVLLTLSSVSIVLFGLFFSTSFAVFYSLAIVFVFLLSLQESSINILFKDNTTKQSLNRAEGLLYSLLNFSWFLGPLIASLVLLSFTENYVFLVAALFFSFSFLYFLVIHVMDSNKTKYKKCHLFRNIKAFISSKSIMLPYTILVGTYMWWAVPYTFIPIMILRSGLPDSVTSIFLAFIIVPLFILEYFTGRISERTGMRILLRTGFLGLTIIGFSSFFISNIFIILGLFIIGSIFQSLIEPLQESYFFKNLKKTDEDNFMPLYLTGSYMGSLLSKLIISTFLIVLPLKSVFLIMATFMFGMFLLVGKVKH